MPRTPPIPPQLWEQIPPPVRAVVAVIIDAQAQRIAALEAQVGSLQKQMRVLQERHTDQANADAPFYEM